MSYYRPSFSQTVAMTRGRGFSSSYRGSSGRSSWGSMDRGRGGFSSSSRGPSGRFSSSFSSAIDSRSKYPPPSSADRYSGASRDYDDYHKSYRSELSASYGGRDGHRSPERKRLRAEGPSSRRSHEGDSFSSSRYQSNSFPDHRSFSRDRRPPSFTSRRDEFRRPSGPPPSSSPRGGYRGRGLRGVRLRDAPPRRRLLESSYAVRRRIAARASSDYARRLKLSRLRSAASRRAIIRRRQISDDEKSTGKDDKASDDETHKEKNDKGESGSEQNEEGKEKKDAVKKSPKKETEKDEKTAESDRDVKPARVRKEFIKLLCPHCNTKCITFSKYSLHLHSSRHMSAMRHVAMKQKSVLARMRLSQRNAQRELEKTTEDLAPRTNFCPLCKLNYKQPKATHQASDTHKSMKKFLMPYCRVCRITFKSPMLYETHICSIDHIKRKSRSGDMNGDKSDKEDGSCNEDENLENFMTIDSVGDVDDEEETKRNERDRSKEPVNVGIEQIQKVEVHYCELCRMYLPRVEEHQLERALSRHCKQRTHMQRYIRYKEDREIANRAERLQRKETAEKEREKSKSNEDKKESTENEDEKKTEDVKTGDDKENEETMDDKLWADDVNKDLGDILAEADESGNKSSDEDEEHATGERYDRFRYSEKNGENDTKEAENNEEQNEANEEEEEEKEETK